MGQNVNALLGGQQALMGADPETYRQQLIQAEQARIQGMAPQQGLAAQLGTLLGRGVTNVAQDRNFFEVTNPVLQKLQKIQGVYDSAMQQADPNDPMSFYTTLQKNFADAGLGQQAMMAATEAQKFEQSNLTGQKLKNEVYKTNPALLDAAIAKARAAGNDPLANQLAEQRGQIQVQIDLDRAKEVAQLGLIAAQTQQAKAAASVNAAQVAAGKLNVQSIPDQNGGATIVYYDPIARKEVDRITVTSAVVDQFIKSKQSPESPTKGERRPLGEVLSTQPVAAPTAQPVAAPVSPGQAANSNTPNPLASNGEYRAAYDPVFLGIQQAIQQDPARLAADPAFMAAITKARNDRVEQLRKQYGNMVNFTGVL